MLVMVIFMVALLTIALAVALPKMSKEIQRDRELETMHRGKQYIRGVRMYYKKFGAYPPNADVLVKPVNNIRFLRKKYADPTTGNAEWKPVRFGQNKAPTAMGFFGQPLGGTGGGCVSTPLSGSSASGSTSSFSNSASSFSGSANCAGTGLNTGASSLNPLAGTNATDPNAASNNTSSSTSGASSTPGSTAGQGGQTGLTLGGGGIIGFSPNSPKQSIMVYKKKNHYNEWEFVYDPLAEQMMAQGGAGSLNGQPAGSIAGSGSGLGVGSGFGSGSGNSGIGTGFGNSPGGTNSGGTVPTPPSPPQQ